MLQQLADNLAEEVLQDAVMPLCAVDAYLRRYAVASPRLGWRLTPPGSSRLGSEEYSAGEKSVRMWYDGQLPPAAGCRSRITFATPALMRR